MTDIESPDASDRDLLVNAIQEIRQARKEVDRLSQAHHAPLAIVGIGCRFPGDVHDPISYWELLIRGIDAVSETPSTRWDVDAFFDPRRGTPGKMYVRHGGYIGEVDKFDPHFFNISPREAESLDPQQRLLLEVAWRALEDAGMPPDDLKGVDAGAFIGLASDDYGAMGRQMRNGESADLYGVLGSARSLAAGRLGYFLGIHGPAIQLDTACSSSLVAVAQACQALRVGQCDLALAGGVNLMLDPHSTIAMCQLQALAADGRNKTFDEAADGYVRGEGCGVVVIKRLDDALAAGDRVWSVIRGIAVNHDGASNGLTAPHGAAQEAVLRRAIADAGIDPLEVGYLETHGSGTSLGDPIEVVAAGKVLCPQRGTDRPLLLGSVKANFGHLEAAAGIASLIKACLIVRFGRLPPQLHLQTRNPKIPWDNLPIIAPLQVMDWPELPRIASPRIAGVSSFGISGTNAHVIIEQPPATIHDRARQATTPRCHLLTISAKDAPALQVLQTRFRDLLSEVEPSDVADICFSARHGRSHFPLRRSIIGASRNELLAQLEPANGHPAIATNANESGQSSIAFLFTGQGAQYAGMGRGLFNTQPVFRRAMERCDAILSDQLETELLQVLWGNTSSGHQINETRFTQPAMFSLQFALFELWRSWGVAPDWLVGHSIGEYAAACAAGIFSLEDALRLVAKRGALIQSLPEGGAMLAVHASVDRVTEAIGDDSEALSIASHNAPDQTIVSGHRDRLDRLATRLTSAGINNSRLHVSHAFHSHLLDPIVADFQQVARGVTYNPPSLKLISTLTGKCDDGAMATPDYWVDQLRQPVLYLDAMQTLQQQQVTACLEIGPDSTLIKLGRRCLAMEHDVADDVPRSLASAGSAASPRHSAIESIVWLPTLTCDNEDACTAHESLGRLYEHGCEIDWNAYDAPFGGRRVTLPGYPFQRKSYWQFPTTSQLAAATLATPSSFPQPDTLFPNPASFCQGLEREHQLLTPRLNEIALRIMARTVKDLTGQWEVGASFSPDALVQFLPERHRPKLHRIICHLINAAWIDQVGGECWIQIAEPAGSPLEMLDALARSHPFPEVELVRRASYKLTAVLRGEAEALTLLFPDGSTDEAARFYSEAPLFRRYNELAAHVMRTLCPHLHQGQKLSAIEIGGGTGGLTSHVLPALESSLSDYLFTDVSPLFLTGAARRFTSHPAFRTAMVDISQDPSNQGLALGGFDVVFAANVLHATPDVRRTLDHVHQLLKPGGWLVLLEGTSPPPWGDMVFALIDGWWLFEDRDLRPDYPLMPASRWREVLGEKGFAPVVALADAEAQDKSIHTLFIAQAVTQKQAALRTTRGEKPVTDAKIGTGHPKAMAIREAVVREAMAGLDGAKAAPESTLQNDLVAAVADMAGRVLRTPASRLNLQRPLLEQGMDSLMVVELRTIVERELEIELPTRILTSSPSVSSIATHLHDELSLDELESRDDKPHAHSVAGAARVSVSGVSGSSAGSSRAAAESTAHVGSRVLVRLQPEGAEPPLFFVPAGYGDLLAFHEVAKLLGFDRPVYGLQPPAAKHVKAIRHMSIYRLISIYIAEIKKVQPHGPYRLSGYSAGGIIAIEMARELTRMGEQVAMLVALDPPVRVPFWLDRFYKLAYRFCDGTHLSAIVRRIRWRPLRHLFHAILDEGLRTHTSVTAGHVTAPFPGRIAYFRATRSWVPALSFGRTRRFWDRVAQAGAEFHWVPGSHYGMLRGNNGEAVAEELRDCLKRT